MNVLIVEDNIIQANALKTIISKQLNYTVHIAVSYDAALILLKEISFDIFLVDIELDVKHPDLNTGIDLSYMIRKNKSNEFSPIIFITSIPNRIEEAINNIHCYNYLIKPYSSEDVIKVLKNLSSSPLVEQKPLSLQDNSGVYSRFPLNEILYISSLRKIITIHMKGTNYETSRYSLKKLMEMLPKNFVQCHKQYIISIDKISHYDRSNQAVNLINVSTPIPVGRKYKNDFEERILI